MNENKKKRNDADDDDDDDDGNTDIDEENDGNVVHSRMGTARSSTFITTVKEKFSFPE